MAATDGGRKTWISRGHFILEFHFIIPRGICKTTAVHIEIGIDKLMSQSEAFSIRRRSIIPIGGMMDLKSGTVDDRQKDFLLVGFFRYEQVSVIIR